MNPFGAQVCIDFMQDRGYLRLPTDPEQAGGWMTESAVEELRNNVVAGAMVNIERLPAFVLRSATCGAICDAVQRAESDWKIVEDDDGAAVAVLKAFDRGATWFHNALAAIIMPGYAAEFAVKSTTLFLSSSTALSVIQPPVCSGAVGKRK